jgi:EKC/KEOPS complex subunit PCC1/LAGE3
MNEDLKAEINIPFLNSNHAKIAYNSLIVDKEPRKELINKKLYLEGDCLKVTWCSKEARILRVSINSFLDHLNLVIKTIDQFSTI